MTAEGPRQGQLYESSCRHQRRTDGRSSTPQSGCFRIQKVWSGRISISVRMPRKAGRWTAEDEEENLHLRRSSSRCHYIDGRGSRRRHPSEKDQRQDQLHRRNRIWKKAFICGRSATRSTTSTKEDKGWTVIGRGSESFYIDRRRKGDHPLRHQDRQDLKPHQNHVVYFSLYKLSSGRELAWR